MNALGGRSKKEKPEEIADARRGEDSVRVWERYRDLGHLWRMIALLQIPLTIIALFIMLSLYFSADTIVEVPEKPQPGHYSVKRLPDSEFINVANEVVNLSSTYTPATAERQFKAARKFLWEPALSQFETDKIKREIPQIVETARSQLFIVDQNQVKVERRPERDFVVVRLPGLRRKMIGSQPLSPDQMVVYVRMTTIPKNLYNDFGIVVTDIRFEDSQFQTYAPKEDATGSAPAAQPSAASVAPAASAAPVSNDEPAPAAIEPLKTGGNNESNQ